MNSLIDRALAGFTDLELLEDNHASSIYSASTKESREKVVIKVVKSRYATPARLARFNFEYEKLRKLNMQGIARILDITEWDGNPMLVMEDFAGIPLKALIKKGLSLKTFFNLAIRIAETLGQLHRESVSHRNITPSSIMINPDTGTVKLVDFGMAQELVSVSASTMIPMVTKENLAYISPEQTGRISAPVDYRVDLYSLGATFYEMLSGKPPYHSTHSLELIQAQVSRMPTPLNVDNPDLPRAVSDIVMKLLAKSPKDRYQSCEGLVYDLTVCRKQWTKQGRIPAFKLGARDRALGFNIPMELVHREDELSVLNAAFSLASQGSVEAVFVTGPAGIGKSALIKEMRKPVFEENGYFISGKFDQSSKDVPYSAIIQAVQDLVLHLLAENEDRLSVLKQNLLNALGKNGKIISDVIPEIETVIGPQPDVPELGPEEALNRFNLLFKNFVRVFADDGHPLVLFLDDLQWADSGSLSLIKTIVTDPRLRFMLLVGAYRDTDVPENHPLVSVREALVNGDIPLHTVVLAPLSVNDTEQLISSFMTAESGTAGLLAKAVHKNTKGSPFFIHQFLKALYDKGHIKCVPGKGWTWDMAKIPDMKSGDNVVTLLVDKIHELPAEFKEVITLSSCIGSRFDVDILCGLTRIPMSEVVAIMDKLARLGMIGRDGDCYRFHHDRIQEAAYTLLPREEQKRIHWLIGNLYLKATDSDQLNTRIFEICDQLNRGVTPRIGFSERKQLVELNLKAGIKAKETAAYAAGESYLAKARAYLPEKSWLDLYELAFPIHIRLMECHYLNLSFKKAEAMFGEIMAHARTRRERAQAYYVMITLYTNTRGPEDTIMLGLKALATLYDIHIPPGIGTKGVVLDLIRTKLWLKRKGKNNREELSVIDNEDLDACLMLFLSIGTPAYYFNQNLFAKLVLKAFNMAVSRGLTVPYESVAIIAVATIIQSKLGDYKQGYNLGKLALLLDYNVDYQKTAGMVHHTFGYLILHWRKHARHCLDIYRKSYQLSLDAGDFIFAGHSITSIADCSLMIGVPLDKILEENRFYDDAIIILKNPFSEARHRENEQYILNLKGQTHNRFTLSDKKYDEDACLAQLHREKNILSLCYTLLLRMKLFYLYGAYEKALEKAREVEADIRMYMGTQIIVDFNFYYSMILTALVMEKKGRFPADRIKVFRNQRTLKTWARQCPENVGHKYDLVAAEVMAVRGCHGRALSLYRSALQKARQNGYLHEEALANERLALYYLRRSGMEEAGMFMQAAYQCYQAWGARAKLDDLIERFPELLTHREGNAAPPPLSGKVETAMLRQSDVHL